MKQKHFQGGKYTGSHTTVTEDAQDFVRMLEKIREVTAIQPGYISNYGGKTARRQKIGVKISITTTRLVMDIKTGTGVQTITVSVKNGREQDVISRISRWSTKRGKKRRGYDIEVIDMRNI